MNKIKVGLFFGGVDRERDISKRSADFVRQHLDPEKYIVQNIEILPNETFLLNGAPADIDKICLQIDIALLALHGLFGEDGTMQRILDEYSVPYTGSDALAASVSFSKFLTKQVFEKFGIKTPPYKRIKKEQLASDVEIRKQAKEMFLNLPQPCVVKPSSSGSSVGVSLCGSIEEIHKGLKEASQIGSDVIVEEYIEGCEVTVGVIDHFRGQDIYILPAVEIVPAQDSKFFDFDTKYYNRATEICPAVLDQKVKDELSGIAGKVHSTLHLKDYSRTDFIIHPKRGIFALEVNALPGLSETCLFPRELASVGISMGDFLDDLIEKNYTPRV